MSEVHQSSKGVPHRLRRDLNAKPYGAYELKARYQRGMLFGTLTTALIAVLFSSLIVYSTPVEKPLPPPGSLDTIVIDLSWVDWSEPDEPQIDKGNKKRLIDKPGTPIPISDDEVLDEEILIPTRIELEEWVDAQRQYIGDTAGKTIIFRPFESESEYPEENEFILVEIQPEMIYMARPVYPNLAKIANLEGKVWVKALVDKNGDVVRAVVLKSSESNAGFDEAAIRAAKRCKFRPAVQNGFNVAVWVSFAVEFKLRN